MNFYTNDNNQGLAAFLSKHIVAVILNLSKENLKFTFTVTSFVLEIQKNWFLVTSSHIFDKLDEYTQSGYAIDSSWLVDYFDVDAIDNHLIPFPDWVSKACRFDKIDAEMDIAIVPIHAHYQRLLEKNKIRPFDETTWNVIPDKVDAFWLIGLPSELINETDKKISMTPLGLHVYPTTDKPKNFIPSISPRFYGTVDLPEGIGSIKGMSGGPILQFYQGKYWVIAVQSSWWPDTRFIEAVPIKYIAQAVSKYLDSLFKRK